MLHGGKQVPPSQKPLLTTTTTTLPPIVIAGAMMYEAELAQALARRIMEAVTLGAWIIVGDDDTGQREDGRDHFEAELRRTMTTTMGTTNTNTNLNLTWIKSTVQCKSLGWKEKQVQILHINPPPDLVCC